jgi:hypothetical protein
MIKKIKIKIYFCSSACYKSYQSFRQLETKEGESRQFFFLKKKQKSKDKLLMPPLQYLIQISYKKLYFILI